MIDLGRVHDEVTHAIAIGFHQLENADKITSMRTAAEVIAATDGGMQRYLNNPMYRAKVQTLVAAIMERIVPVIETNLTKEK